MQGNSNPNNELVKLCHDKQEMMDDVTALFLEAHGGVKLGLFAISIWVYYFFCLALLLKHWETDNTS